MRKDLIYYERRYIKGYMRKQSKSNWLSWSNRYGYE